MCSFAETTHTPQGDGNYQQELDKYTQKKQPTPRKGTETGHIVIHLPFGGNNPHPARGRKPAYIRVVNYD